VASKVGFVILEEISEIGKDERKVVQVRSGRYNRVQSVCILR
jgi:hypothetical protein